MLSMQIDPEAQALIARHENLAAQAEDLAAEWLEHKIVNRDYAMEHCAVLLDENNQERKKVERKLRKKFGIQL